MAVKIGSVSFDGGYVDNLNVEALYLGSTKVWERPLELSTMVITILEGQEETISVVDNGGYTIATLTIDSGNNITTSYSIDKNGNTPSGATVTAATPFCVWTLTGYFEGDYYIKRDSEAIGSLNYNGRTKQDTITINAYTPDDPEPEPTPTPTEPYTYISDGYGVWCSATTTGCVYDTAILPTYSTAATSAFTIQVRTTILPSDWYYHSSYTDRHFGNLIGQKNGKYTTYFGVSIDEISPNLESGYAPRVNYSAGHNRADRVYPNGQVDRGSAVVDKITNMSPWWTHRINWTLSTEGIYNNNNSSWIMQKGASSRAKAFNNSNPLYINFGIMPIKQIVFYSNGNVVFNGRAAVRNADGVYGLYDNVSKTFITVDGYNLEEYNPNA